MVNGDGVDGGHQTFFNSPVVIENLSDWSQAVSGARGVGNNGHVRVISFVVDSNNKDWGVILWWGRDDGFLGSSLNVLSSIVFLGENTSALTDVVSSRGSPLDVSWGLLVINIDMVSINLDTSFGLLNFSLESSYKLF